MCGMYSHKTSSHKQIRYTPVVVAKTQTNYTQTRRQSNLDQDRRRNLKLGRLQVHMIR
jgi:hypothetical protein